MNYLKYDENCSICREPKTQNLPYIEVVVEKLFEEGAKLGVYSPLKDAVEQIKQEEFEKLEYLVYAMMKS